MPSKKISALPVLAEADIAIDDYLPIVDKSLSITKRITVNDLASRVDASVELTVGTGGDYSTINAALTRASQYAPLYKSFGVEVTIRLLTGFAMAEQVFVEGKDLSFITIVSDDAEVTITRSAITAQPTDDNWRSGTYPAFAAHRNGHLPIIGALFSFDSSGTADGRVGVLVKENSSAVIRRDCGIKNCPWRGLYVDNGYVYARDTIWSGSGTATGPDGSRGAGIRIANGAIANVRDSVATACGTGLYVSESFVQAFNCNFSGAVNTGSGQGDGVFVGPAGRLYMEDCNVSGAAQHGVWADDTSIVHALDINAANCASSGIYAERSSHVTAHNATITGCGRAITVLTGASVSARDATATGSKTRAISVSDGGYCDISGADLSNSLVDSEDNAIRVFGGGKVDAIEATISHNARAGTATAHLTMESGTGCVVNITGAVDEAAAAIRRGTIPTGLSPAGFLIDQITPIKVMVDVSIELAAADPVNVVQATTLSNNRQLLLPNPSFCYEPIRVVRTAASGNSGGTRTLNVAYPNNTTLKSLNTSEWCIMAPDAANMTWIVMAAGTV